MSSDIHSQAAAMAAMKGSTLNDYINQAIVRLLEEDRAVYYSSSVRL